MLVLIITLNTEITGVKKFLNSSGRADARARRPAFAEGFTSDASSSNSLI